jgi:hypothetical protein
MIRRTWVARLFTTAVAVVVAGGTAAAGIIPGSVTITPEGQNFRWQYSVVLPTDMKLQAGDYFTIYDFGGLVAGSQFVDPQNSSASDWVMEVSKTGPIPNGLNPKDNPDIENLVFRYVGAGIPSGQLGIGNFGATSTVGTSVKTDFTAQNPQVNGGNLDRNIVDTIAPAPPGPVDPTPGVPEPTTLLLAGIGLPALRLFRKRSA